MLKFGSTQSKTDFALPLDVVALPPGVNWIDAIAPDAAEIEFLRQKLGVDAPNREDLVEIENSSRLYVDNGLLYMSLPMIEHLPNGLARTIPLGLTLGRDFLLTLRFDAIKACDDLHGLKAYENMRAASGPNAFAMVTENMVDALADELERMTAELDRLSQVIFEQGRAEGDNVKLDNKILRNTLSAISGNGFLIAKTLDTLLGVSRMVGFVAAEAKSFVSAEESAKLKSLTRDVASLMEHARSQNDRLQLLLDATLGLTNIEQNNIFRLLTVVSVIGIPPTLVASAYGMNFKNMPELDWAFGYEWGLMLIVLSALLPALWFKRRGWW